MCGAAPKLHKHYILPCKIVGLILVFGSLSNVPTFFFFKIRNINHIFHVDSVNSTNPGFVQQVQTEFKQDSSEMKPRPYNSGAFFKNCYLILNSLLEKDFLVQNANVSCIP
jgi:1-acyl-sn-glycerol-3-phosphate acyltransferase